MQDRDEAEQLFYALRAGHVRVKGGWRIYFSVPGILINQIVSNFLGLKLSYDDVAIDPILPKQLDGLQFAFAIDEKPITVIFLIASDTPAVGQPVTINGIETEFRRDHNPYRPGGVRIPHADFHSLLIDGTIAFSSAQPNTISRKDFRRLRHIPRPLQRSHPFEQAHTECAKRLLEFKCNWH